MKNIFLSLAIFSCLILSSQENKRISKTNNPLKTEKKQEVISSRTVKNKEPISKSYSENESSTAKETQRKSKRKED